MTRRGRRTRARTGCAALMLLSALGACAAATAAHVGAPVAAVATAWRETGPDGLAVFEARDGDRLHLCSVDAGGRVLRLDHPRGEAG